MDDSRLLRYSRHILLPQVDIAGQETLLRSRATIIGLGGLGSPVAMYLAAAGVGHLRLVDADTVELSNLQRQIVHTTGSIGRDKVASAATTLQALNPTIEVEPIRQRFGLDDAERLCADADVVLDCTDTFDTRLAVNAACVALSKPLVSGAAIRFEGQVAVFRPDLDGPCYQCLYRQPGQGQERCSQTGVLAPLLGIIGSIQATEAIKVLLNSGERLEGRMLLLDGLTMEFNTIKFGRDPACPCCGVPGSAKLATGRG